jgi:transcriptional regulator with XRE-family HTH domain
MVPAPPIRRRLVGKALRRHRESHGYTLNDAAKILDCDRSKVSRIETGHRGIRPKELRELLAEYDIDAAQQALLIDLADPRGAFGWYRDYADVLPGAWRDYFILETAASTIHGYEAQQVPGLLQTRAYARAVAKADPHLLNGDAHERAADAVQLRQQAIFLAERAPDIHLIIGEAALHLQVGGSEVIRQQLSHLARVAADNDAVTVQVLEFESGAHAATGDGSLAIARVTDAPELGVVHLGGVGGGVCLEGGDSLAAYADAFDQLRAFALSPAQSASLLRGLVGE